jgi:hypothetical protein
MSRAGAVAAAGVALILVGTGSHPAAQPRAESREVRQLVTFRFLPGQTRAALDVYRSALLPIYRAVDAMRTVRVYAEVESPEPLDLMVVTHYADMAGMDRANRALRALPPDGPSIGQLYRQVADLSLGHHDQFVEVISPPNVAATPDGLLEVLEFLRIQGGGDGTFERQMLDVVHPWEEELPVRNLIVRSETARFLVADGWDYLRTYAVRDLAAWQAYTTARARHPAAFVSSRMVEQRKTMVLREVPDLRVR